MALRPPAVFIADEPTRGVDVGAKSAIYALIKSLAADGIAVLLISSEHEEVLGLAHRVLVMHGGRIVAEFDQASMNEDAVLHAAFGMEAAAEAPLAGGSGRMSAVPEEQVEAGAGSAPGVGSVSR